MHTFAQWALVSQTHHYSCWLASYCIWTILALTWGQSKHLKSRHGIKNQIKLAATSHDSPQGSFLSLLVAIWPSKITASHRLLFVSEPIYRLPYHLERNEGERVSGEWNKLAGTPEWLSDMEMESGEPIEVGKKTGRGGKKKKVEHIKSKYRVL